MINFSKIDKQEIKEKYIQYFHEDAVYFQANKNDIPLCIYGVIDRHHGKGEAFLMLKSFYKKVLTKEFFYELFKHAFSLGFKELYTWTQWDRLIKLFDHFGAYGIEKTSPPVWDKDVTKCWFIKRI